MNFKLDDGLKGNCINEFFTLLKMRFSNNDFFKKTFLTVSQDKTDITDYQANSFTSICKSMIHDGAFDTLFKCICWFYCVKNDNEPKYDIDLIESTFEKIPVNENYNLKQLSDFYLKTLSDCQKNSNMSDRIRLSVHYIATKITVCKYILGFDEVEIPDGLNQSFIEQICEKCDVVKDDRFPESKKVFTFGVLCSLLQSSRWLFDQTTTDYRPVFYYAFKEKIFPLFSDCYNGTEKPASNHISFFNILNEFYFQLSVSYKSFTSYNKFNSMDPSSKEHVTFDGRSIVIENFANLLKEDFKNKDFIKKLISCSFSNVYVKDVTMPEIEIADTEIGEQLVYFIVNNPKLISYAKLSLPYYIGENLVDDLFVIGLICMFTEDKNDKYLETILENKHLISEKHLQTPYIKLLLSKLLLSCNDIKTLDTLYTLANVQISENEVKQKKKDLRVYSNKILIQLDRIEEFIKNAKGRIGKLYDKIYSTDELKNLKSRILTQIEKYGYPKEYDFKKLLGAADSFSRDGYVNVVLLHSYFPLIPKGNNGGNIMPPDDKVDGLDYRLQRPLAEITKEIDDQNILKTHYTVLDQRELWLHLKFLFEKQRIKVLKKSIFKDIENIKNAYEEKEADKFLLNELDSQVDELVKIYMSSDEDSIKKSEEALYASQRAFTKEYFGDENKNLFANLKNTSLEQTVKKYILTSDLVYNHLSSLNDNNLDFSAALISLTKALELILNEKFYTPMKAVIDADTTATNNDKPGTYNSSESLGTYIGFIWDVQKRKVPQNGNNQHVSNLYLDNGKIAIRQPGNHFDRYNGDNYLDFSILGDYFDGFKVNILDYNLPNPDETQAPLTLKFEKGNNDYNRLLFACLLDYIRAKYRNPVAHKDIIASNHFEEARKCILYKREYQDFQAALWLLLSIIK
jgi:hypothetical protein